jgi:pimeloyl-ACP methyl ester carboxylesterase
MKNVFLRCAAFLIFGGLYLGANAQSVGETRYFTTTDGVRIAYDDNGGPGEIALLIHGFINTRKNWEKALIKKDLITQGYRVIAIDLRGNGESDSPKTPESYANDIEVKDIMALMDHLKIKKYNAIGYSRGSIVLAKLLTQDNHIAKAVLGGMGLDFTDAEWSRRKAFAVAFADPAARTVMTQGAVDYAKSIGRDTLILSYQQVYQPVTTQAELKTVSIPVLIIAGSEDTDNGSPNTLAAVFSNSQLSIVPGDHNNTYKTQAFADQILRFLRDK